MFARLPPLLLLIAFVSPGGAQDSLTTVTTTPSLTTLPTSSSTTALVVTSTSSTTGGNLTTVQNAPTATSATASSSSTTSTTTPTSTTTTTPPTITTTPPTTSTSTSTSTTSSTTTIPTTTTTSSTTTTASTLAPTTTTTGSTTTTSTLKTTTTTTPPLPTQTPSLLILGSYNTSVSFGVENYIIWWKILADIQADPTLSLMWNLTLYFNDTTTAGGVGNIYTEEPASMIDMMNIVSTPTVAVSAVFGPENFCEYEPRMAAAFNVIMMSTSCTDPRSFNDTTGSTATTLTSADAPTFTRLYPSNNDYFFAANAFMTRYNWSTVAFICPDSWEVPNDQSLQDAIITELTTIANVNMSSFQQYYRRFNWDPLSLQTTASLQMPSISNAIAKSYLNTRIFVFLPYVYYQVTLYLSMLDRMGLLQTGEYFTIAIYKQAQFFYADNKNYNFTNLTAWLIPTNSNFTSAYNGINPTKIAQIGQWTRTFAGLARTPPMGATYTNLQTNVSTLASTWPCTAQLCPPKPALSVFNPAGYQVAVCLPMTYNQLLTYDAAMLYARTIARNSTSTNIQTSGTIYMGLITAKTYTSAGGFQYYIDVNNMVSGNLTVLHSSLATGLQAYAGFVRQTGAQLASGMQMQTWTLAFNQSGGEFNWINGPAPGGPACGFAGQLCITAINNTWEWITIGLVALALFLIIIMAFLIKQWMYERALQSMLWKIGSNELTMQKKLTASLGSLKSIGSDKGSLMGTSRTSLRMVQSHLMLRDYEQNLMKEAMKETAATKKTKKELAEQAATLEAIREFGVAVYKGNFVGIKRIYKTSVDLNREVRKELKVMRDVKHDNISAFIGAVHDPPSVFLVIEYTQRGSLKDLLENDQIHLDQMFMSSIVFDILKGLLYIHDSEIGWHGRLKSSNCLVDSRWVIKLSSYGLRRFRAGETMQDASEETICRTLIWTAPELLRDPIHRNLGSLKGDVYSFGIILHEVFGRSGPFGNDLADPIEAIDLLKTPQGGELLRPELSYVENAPSYVVNVMQRCWAEIPDSRPSFFEIRKQLKPLTVGLKANIFDNMLSMMEKYTNNLEGIVAERTKQLDEEKKKSERLLLQMLPKFIADQLKIGKPVEAETFECVTIYFSDIVGFVAMSTDSTPMQVVAFLNDMYTMMDAILARYDIYKVETIGDSYMVVSGLPQRNGLNHVGEICSLSLHLMEDIKLFKIRHRPHEIVKLRIGMHTGPCVAGVIGLKMPRYCLFGDTVNTASRMESNGEALKIHINASTKEHADKLGGYETIERGYVAMKGKGEVLTHWLVNGDPARRRQRVLDEAAQYPSLQPIQKILMRELK